MIDQPSRRPMHRTRTDRGREHRPDRRKGHGLVGRRPGPGHPTSIRPGQGARWWVARLLGACWAHRRLSIGILAWSVVTIALVTAGPLLTRRGVNDAVDGHTAGLAWLVIGLVLIAAIDFVGNYYRRNLAGRLSLWVQHELRAGALGSNPTPRRPRPGFHAGRSGGVEDEQRPRTGPLDAPDDSRSGLRRHLFRQRHRSHGLPLARADRGQPDCHGASGTHRVACPQARVRDICAGTCPGSRRTD